MSIGVVAIGRNEGERLRRCLESLRGLVDQVVYVDSASTDGSVALATELGASVVTLDLSIPFTAARARNAGVERLVQLDPAFDQVQFVDGDCEVVRGWLAAASAALSQDPSVAVVCGRRRERNRELTVYNRLCDLEWDTPVGEARACGGDALIRLSAFKEVSGYDGRLIAGEEPELCVRLRRRGYRILRIDAEMTIHDAAMTSFRQWWRRALRAGHAFAEGAALHGAPPERHWVRETRSLVVWGGIFPLAAILLAFVTHGWSLLALCVGYAALVARVLRYHLKRGRALRDALPASFFTVLAKFPELEGAAQFALLSLLGGRRRLIEWRKS